MNALRFEKSPYLLQHADNPVDWMPWGDAAFEKAKSEDKPVFLSIGYSTCHWCHVMARESFEDERVAAILNDGYVCVKVDREERPDVDQVYMNACVALTGSGGWPLTAFLTADQKPFYVTTYLPRETRFGRMGLVETLGEISRLWRGHRAELLERGQQIAEYLQSVVREDAGHLAPDEETLYKAAAAITSEYDEKNGCFGRAPLFPMPHRLLFLLWQGRERQDKALLEKARAVLSQMRRGGLFDHLGGGFARYSTDGKWLAPHFEKMLYDNAMLAYVYSEAAFLLKEPVFARTARDVLDYVLREMTDESGGFYSAQDADSEGEEGKFYLFTPGETESVLGKDAAAAFCRRYDVTPRGNFEGRSIPNLLLDPEWRSADLDFQAQRAKLYAYRAGRRPLRTDDKVLTAWNGLMIAALSRAGTWLGREDYLAAADRAADFLCGRMLRRDGTLLARYRDGDAAIDGTLEDYAFLAWGLLEHYRARLRPESLLSASRMAERMQDLFWDDARGGYFMTASHNLIVRPKESYDGAMPSGNGAAALVLAELSACSARREWRERLQRQMDFLASGLRWQPDAHAMALCAARFALSEGPKLLVACADEEQASRARQTLLRKRRDKTQIQCVSPKTREIWNTIDPDTRQYPLPDSGCRWYMCRAGACEAPTERFPEAAFEDLSRMDA